MKRNWRLVGGVVTLLAVTGGTWTWRSDASKTQNTRVTNPVLLPHQHPQSVGWVFGRLIGVPGADKPLMSGSGMASRLPPTSGAHR